MRVITGKYKGMPLNSPQHSKIRPTADKVKQAMFTKLQFEVSGITMLDLFAGSGAVGIEAISRGAEKVVMVDKDYNSIKLIKSNISKLSSCDAKKISLYNTDYATALKTTKDKYDLIFIDPPYAFGLYENCLDLIFNNNLLKKGGYVVCEHLKETLILTDKFCIVDVKNYGTVALTYLTL